LILDQSKERILFITSGFPRKPEDPMARFILDFAVSLSDKDYAIVVLAPLAEGALREENWNGLKIYRFPYFYPEKYMKLAYGDGLLFNIKKSYLATFQIPFFFLSEFLYGLKIARKEKVSIIHAHWLIPQGLISVFIKCVYPVKNVVTVHGSDIRIPPNWLSKLILRKMDAIISPHPEITRVLRSLGDFPIYEIPNVIDESLFNPDTSPSGIKDDLEITTTHVITFVARLNEFKDPITFVKSIPFVVEQEPDVTFLIAGDGPLMGDVRTLIESLEVQKYVRVLGNRQDVNRILKISSVFVAMSPYENIWSLVIIEAMKMGVPCIITNSGTTQKYLRANVDAILIPSRDERTLAREIIRLLHDNNLRNNLCERGRILMDSHFSTEHIVSTYDKLISSLFEDEKER
jgi:glycosyltransferase involved in cell wall biosynthesis